MERYKGYQVPITSVKGGTLLKKLADREQTTSDDLLHFATKPDPQERKVIGPTTSTEELLEALDLAISSEEDHLDSHKRLESESLSTQDETADGDEALVTVPTKKKRRSRKEIQAAAAGNDTYEEPKFVELTKLLPPVPKKGTFEVNAVKKSLYFFS